MAYENVTHRACYITTPYNKREIEDIIFKEIIYCVTSLVCLETLKPYELHLGIWQPIVNVLSSDMSLQVLTLNST
jgi:hypothetical protein